MSRTTYGPVVALQAACLAVTGTILVFLLGADFGPLESFMGRWSFLILELGGALACLMRAALIRAERLAWALLGTGALLWALGDTYYRAVLFEMDSPPVPSPADGLWIAFYPFAYAGIGLLIRERATNVRVTVWIDALIAALAVATLAATVVFDAVLQNIGGAPLTTAINLSYPLADMLLMAFVAAGFALTGWRLDRTWVWLAASLALFAVSDSLFLYEVAQGTYVGGGVLDAGWMLALMLAGAAAWQLGSRSEAVVREERRNSIVFPIFFALIVVGIEIYDHFHRVPLLAVAFAGICLLTVLLRLAITFAQNLGMLETSKEEAATDALTGLANRRRLNNHLLEALDQPAGAPTLLVLFDLNGFKLYNDTFGHPAGDALLTRLGGRLAEAVAGRGCAYRMGGDEFCVLVECADEPEALVATIAPALSEQGEGFMIDASYGWAMLSVEAADPESALRLVDQRMYSQKQGGRASARAQSKNVLVQALLERSPGLSNHLSAVSEMAIATARHLSIDETELLAIETAGALHDIGKFAIPDEILTKTGPLDRDEWEYVKRHSEIGERIIAAAPALAGVAKLVRSIHEWVDGTGYPDGLAGDQIPVGARIVAVCDAFEAMTSGDRPYRVAVAPEVALAELRRCAGSQFDPAVVEAFCTVRGAAARVPHGVPTPGSPVRLRHRSVGRSARAVPADRERRS